MTEIANTTCDLMHDQQQSNAARPPLGSPHKCNSPYHGTASSSDCHSSSSFSFASAQSVAPLVELTGHFLRYGYMLLSTDPEDDSNFAYFRKLRAAMQSHSGVNVDVEAVVAAGDKACQSLVEREDLKCFQLITADVGYPALRAVVPAPALIFFGEATPSTSIQKYLTQLVRHVPAFADPEVILFAVVYMSRFVNTGIPCTARSVHRIMLAAFTVAAKARSESCVGTPLSMSHVAHAGGITAKALLHLELEFMSRIHSELNVTPIELVAMSYAMQSCYRQLSAPLVAPCGTWAEVYGLLPNTREADLLRKGEGGEEDTSAFVTYMRRRSSVSIISPEHSPRRRRHAPGSSAMSPSSTFVTTGGLSSFSVMSVESEEGTYSEMVAANPLTTNDGEPSATAEQIV